MSPVDGLWKSAEGFRPRLFSQLKALAGRYLHFVFPSDVLAVSSNASKQVIVCNRRRPHCIESVYKIQYHVATAFLLNLQPIIIQLLQGGII